MSILRIRIIRAQVKTAADLAIKHSKDLNASELTKEIMHFKRHPICTLPNDKNIAPLELLEYC